MRAYESHSYSTQHIFDLHEKSQTDELFTRRARENEKNEVAEQIKKSNINEIPDIDSETMRINEEKKISTARIHRHQSDT